MLREPPLQGGAIHRRYRPRPHPLALQRLRTLLDGVDGVTSTLFVVPVELAEANAFIAAHHRHHRPVIGHRFSIGCIDGDGVLHGVAVVGRPVARLAGAPRDVLEVTRLATDGTRNACSILYAAAARAGKALGFRRIQTYTLPVEGGASLRASGWRSEGAAGGGQWKHTDGKPRRTDQPTDIKTRWALDLAQRPDLTSLGDEVQSDDQPTLFGGAA